MSELGFNLVTDPWIPVEGGPLSIERVLVDAHRIDGWPCSDPAFAEVLIRLLVPMVYRITGMDDPNLSRDAFADRQRDLLSDGRFDPEAVRTYLSQHQHRFWLVNPPDGHAPFAQDRTLAGAEPKPPSKAVTAWASGNNPLWGPHASCDRLLPDIAAQQLLVSRCYSSGGTHTKHPAHSGQGKFVGAPLRGTTCIHPVGENFTATLVGHLVPLPYDTEFGLPFWETDAYGNPVLQHYERAGLLQQIAVRNDKTMLLSTDQAGDITGFVISEGPGVAKDLFCNDPYWLVDGERTPIKPRDGRAFWREAEVLLGQGDDGTSGSCDVLDWAKDVDGGSDNYEPDKFSWAAIQHRGDKSKELAWVCSHAPTLLSLFDAEVGMRCKDFLRAAAEAEGLMVKQLAKVWYDIDLMPSDPKNRGAVYAPAQSRFWGTCEADFWETATRPVVDAARDTRLRESALAGYDLATAPYLRDRRTLDIVIQGRRWIERWQRQPAERKKV